ncbi:MAG: SDR family NAD(P)-dependent oxidoreductase, partial [Gammaproteobacteria bacterium]|nr:SDR family NAD(P)-dependent oxidoreductase [Gammaproteobacteria bacterium]
IDVLINNAGISLPGPIEAHEAAGIDMVMQTNFTGPMLLTRALLPAMRAQGRGAVLFVSSLSALVGLPGDGLYAASKAALEAAAEALRFEVERFGIRVAVIEPGLIATAMAGKIAAAGTPDTDAAYAPLLAHLQRQSAAAIGRGDDPAVVVEALFKALDEPDPPFRIPAGSQAEAVIEELGTLDDSGRAAFIRRVAGTGWWSRGADAPAPEDP